MIELKPEEEAALIEALNNRFLIKKKSPWFGRAMDQLLKWNPGAEAWQLNAAGQACAQSLHDLAAERKRSGELERAQELLREWREKAGYRYYRAHIEWRCHEPVWRCEMCVLSEDVATFHSEMVSQPDPLTAVIEASKQTPWPVGTEE